MLASTIPTGKIKSVLNSLNSFQSIPISLKEREKTTFITPWGRFRYRVSPQGYLASMDGYTLYLNLPHGVMKVVLSLSSSTIGTEWNEFQTSRTDFILPAGTAEASMKGLFVWCVCLTEALFKACMSTVLLGSPLCLGTTTILEHQVTGVLTGTGSITPRATSLKRSLWTFSSQCRGTGTGVCTAVGLTSALTGIGRGSPFINGRVCLVHLLKADAA